MRHSVCDRLNRIEDLFPPARIEQSKARWRALWSGEKPDRMPFVYYPVTFNYYDDLHTPEERLDQTLDEIFLRGRMNDDFVPSLFPGCRQSTIPTMFGAREIVVGSDCTCEPVIRALEDIDLLPESSMGPETVAGFWLDLARYTRDETEGRLPIHVTDMQGPLDVAAQMWCYDELLTAPYMDPVRYHRLMSAVTHAFIDFWRAQQDLLGDCFVGTHLFGWDWTPPGTGASLSADSLVMLSPDFYRNYVQPYLQEIVAAFGGLSVHSCGDFSPVIPAVCATPGVKAVNAGQMSVPELARAGMPSETLAIAMTPYDGVAQVMAAAREAALRVDLTVFFPWPSADGRVIDPALWSFRDWDRLHAQEQWLLETLHATPAI